MDHAEWKRQVAALQALVRQHNSEGARAQLKGDDTSAAASYAGATHANSRLVALQGKEPRR